MELEALAAIYMDDYKRIDDGTGEPTFELQLVPVTGGENNHVSLCLRVTFPASYPETSPPILKVRSTEERGSCLRLRRIMLDPARAPTSADATCG